MSTPIQLPLDVASALAPNNIDQFAAPAPVQPGTQMPLAPNAAQTNAAATPDNAPDIQPQHPVDRLANLFMSHLIAKDQAAQPQRPPQQRGDFASKLQGALGDASHANDIKGGGWLTGVTSTLAARGARKSEEQKAADEHAMTMQTIADNQARTVATMSNIHRQEAELQDKAYAEGAQRATAMKQNHQVEENVSQSDLNKRVTTDPKLLESHYAIATGKEQVLDGNGNPKMDANGNPVTSPIYSLVDRQPLDEGTSITVTPEVGAQLRKAGMNVPDGTKMTADQFQAFSTRAQGINNSVRMLEKANDEDMSEAQLKAVRQDLSDPAVQSAIAKYPGRPLRGLSEFKSNIDQHIQQTQQQIAALSQKNPNDPQIAALKDQQGKMQAEESALSHFNTFGVSDKMREDEVKAQDDDRKARHDAAEEAIQNRRADIQAQKETQQKGLGDSYKTENKEFDTIRKPLDASLGAFSTLRSSLDQGTAAGDSVVAPALLKALVAGGGVRITQAEITNFTHGRSTLEDMKGYLQKLSNGKQITPEQRKQVYALLGAVEAKAQQKNQILEDGQDALDNAGSVQEQRQAVQDARRKLSAIDAGTQQQAPPKTTNAAPTTHTFNSQAWAAANPGKDVNAAIAQAKQQGYQIQ